MALINCDFFSDALGVSTSMTVILPEATESQIGMTGVVATPDDEGFPTLYLLHGLSDDHTTWQRRTSIERHVAPLGLAVVMPAVSRSFYTDEVFGLKYWTFVSEELPAKAESLFRLSARRENRFVAGLSMGGYGAFKLALRRPERFAAAASLSGALDLARILRDREDSDDPRMMKRLFGDAPVAGTDDDLFALLATAKAAPPLYLSCGIDDALIGDNYAFELACAEHGIDLTTDYGPGEHEWGYWDRTIQDVLAWLPLPWTAGPGA
jgi:putative tributyrin esterase